MISAGTEDEARALIARFDSRAEHHVALHKGRKQTWRKFGEGPPVVLLHGGHGSWLHWIRNIDALSRDHTLRLPDMPSFGDSESLEGHPHAADRMQRFVEAISAGVDSLLGSRTPIQLGGFLFGGITAAFLAAQHARVARLALIGAGAHHGARRQTIELVDWRLPDRAARLAALRHNLVPFMLSNERRADALALAIHEHSCATTRFRSKAIAQRPAASGKRWIASPRRYCWLGESTTSPPCRRTSGRVSSRVT